MDADKTPPQIVVWVCPECGYWRQEPSTLVHVDYGGKDPGETHRLVKAAYIYEGDAE